MPDPTADILIFGTGAFAQRIACDLAATAAEPVRIAVAGRNRERLAWIRTAANARAALFGRPAVVVAWEVDLTEADAPVAALDAVRPTVVVQAASAQPAAVIAGGPTAWTRLVAIGGLSATAVFQSVLTLRVAHAVTASRQRPHLVNCCFPDVVNGLVAAAGYQIACGVGNVAILATAFAGARLAAGAESADGVKVLAHYQNLAAWRRPPAERRGAAARVWIDGAEVDDVYGAFPDVQLTAAPAVDISGASGVPLFLALAAGRTWTGHVPGPGGMPGGYPVTAGPDGVALDLPPGLDRDEAVAWNDRHERESGLVVEDGRVRYTGALEAALRAESPDLAAGFAIADIDAVHRAMADLRTRLEARPAA